MTARPRRRALVRSGRLLLFAAVLASCLACVPPGDGRPGPGQPPAGEPAGRLAFIGADGNVYVTTVGASAPLQLTHDATAPAEDQGLSYHRLAWSPTGALAFAAVERSGTGARGRLYVVDSVDDASSPPRLVAENPDHFLIYAYWSPADPGRLAYLIAEDGGVGLHLVDLSQEPASDSLLAAGRPFYLSWASDGQRLAWHAGPDLVVYDLDAERSAPIVSPSAAFRAPTWAPDPQAPARWLAAISSPAADGEDEGGATATDHLTAFSGTTPTPLLPLSGAEIAFSWSPDATHIAYAQRANAGDPFYSPIHLLTSASTHPPIYQPTPLTPAPFRPLAFFWSPDGDRLAYLSWLDLPNVTWAQWRVVDVATGDDRGYAAFRPSPLMQFALTSFDQYAQSHRFWSPDGRYLVYAARDRRGLDQIWLVDTRAAPGTDPLYVADGPLAYWSFD